MSEEREPRPASPSQEKEQAEVKEAKEAPAKGAKDVKESSKTTEVSKKDSDSKKERKDDKDRKDKDKDDRKDKKSSRRSRSRSRDKDKKRRSRSRSRDKKRRSRSRSDSRSRRRKSRSRSRDRKKSSSRRSRSRDRSRDRRRSRSRDRDRRARSRDRSRDRSHRRHGGGRSRSASSSDSGLGGYKPRKRQDTPAVMNGPGTGADPYANYRQKVTADPAQQVRQWQLQQLQARVMVLEQQAKSAATATSKTQREVYVGGLIPGVVTSEAPRTLFNSALAVQFAGQLTAGMDPVINVNMHVEGKYSFVEFRTPDMATAALALSGQVQLMGCNISVARPSGFVDPTKAQCAYSAASEALSALERGDMDGVAAAALKGANLQGLGLPPHIADPSSATAVQLPPGVAIDGVQSAPSTNCVFLGMVTADRLKDEQEYSDMKEDLVEQCGEYAEGCVEGIKIPRPHDPQLSDQYLGIANYGRIFVKFNSAASASVCKDKLHGRMYGGQQVQVFYINDEAYDKIQ